MSELTDMILLEAEEGMSKAVAHARTEFASIRTGRASSNLVERLIVNYYGSEVPMQQLASFSVPEARMLVISPFDKSSIESIEKTIREADLGLNPSNDGTIIRLGFPILTEERRRDYVRMVKAMAEEGRIRIRGLRRGARHDLDALHKDGDASEDEVRLAEKELDKLKHAGEAGIDSALGEKETELLEV